MPSLLARLRLRATASTWHVPPLRPVDAVGGWRVETRWAGHPLWFESADVPLVPCSEALAAVTLLPALAVGGRIVLDEPLAPDFEAALPRLAATFRGWWPLPGDLRLRAPRPDAASGSGPAPADAAKRTALCFTGGVDSFHALLADPDEVDTLLYVHGYDIPADDISRMAVWQRDLREIARETGKRVLVVRTNLREHPAFANVSWEWSHGAGLAAAALLLRGHVERLRIASSYVLGYTRPWGSHPDTDPLWSTPWLRIEHWGRDWRRLHKFAAIARDRLVRRTLRVCWENRSPSGNCSRCEKCVRAMVSLAGLAQLEAFDVFDRSVPLARRLDDLDFIPANLEATWEHLRDLPLTPDVQAALERLVARSTA